MAKSARAICDYSPEQVIYQAINDDKVATYTISFVGEINPTSCITKWEYHVTQEGAPAISHIVIPVATCDITPTPISNVTFNRIPIPENPGPDTLGYQLTIDTADPSTCVEGVKFEGLPEASEFTISFETPPMHPIASIVGLKASGYAFTEGGCPLGPGVDTATLGCAIWSPGCPCQNPCVEPVQVECKSHITFDVVSNFTLTLDSITINTDGCECGSSTP